MPAILGTLPKDQLIEKRKHLLDHNEIAPLVVSFKNGRSLCGLFCCLLVFLINEQKWRLKPVNSDIINYQNLMEFNLPNSSFAVTLIDLITHFEIHVKAADDQSPCKHQSPYKQVRKGIEIWLYSSGLMFSGLLSQ